MNGSSLTATEVRALEDKHRDLLILCLKLEELAADFDTGEIHVVSRRLPSTLNRWSPPPTRWRSKSSTPTLSCMPAHASAPFFSIRSSPNIASTVARPVSYPSLWPLSLANDAG